MLAPWVCASNGWVLSFLTLLYLLLSTHRCSAQQQDGSLSTVSISNTDSQITYSPFLCDSSNNNSSDAQCNSNGGWQVQDVDGVSVVSTQGPGPAALNIVPQMFLRVRASVVTLTTSSQSNATMNVTVSAGNASVSVQANSSLGVVGIFNLYEAETTTITITYVPDSDLIPSRLDIGDITAQVTNNAPSSSILPSMTLPPSVSLPTSFPSPTSSSATSTPSAVSGSSQRQLVADAVGLTIGLGLGLSCVAVGGYLFWRRRKRRKGEDVETRTSQQGSTSRASDFRGRTPRNKDNQDTRWF